MKIPQKQFGGGGSGQGGCERRIEVLCKCKIIYFLLFLLGGGGRVEGSQGGCERRSKVILLFCQKL